MIDNNIIQSLGAGSGIDSKGMVKQLTEIERAAPQQRIDSRRDKAETQISDFGSLAAAMDTFKTSVSALSEREGMYSKNASFTDSNALVPTKLGTDVQAGTYSFEVKSVARSQSLSFAGFTDTKAAVGEGELTFDFGSWSRIEDEADPNFGKPSTFDLDPEAEPFTIKIDASNNTLEGLRDAINKADKGVQASIINDGNSHRLIVTAPSGEQHEMRITASEAAGGADNIDSSGLSRFAHNDAIAGFADTETQSGSDATLIVNGLTVKRPSNTIDDVVPGLTMDILKASPGEIVSITISDDKAFAEENVRAFVDSYNAFLEEVKPLFGFNKAEEEGEEGFYGSLRTDALAKSVLSRFRAVIASEVPGLADTDFTSLANVGIRTQLDGSLSINEKDFREAFDNNFASVQKLFSSETSSSSSDITVNSFGKQTKAGNYDVQITTQPQKGYYTGQSADAGLAFPDFDPAARDYSMALTVNGTKSGNIVIPTDVTYASVEELAGAMEAAVNADEALKATGAAVSVAFDAATNSFTMTSNRYGSSSGVNITMASAALSTDLGLTVANGTAGVNVAGTVNGVEGFGLGNVLLPKLGEEAEGLSLIIGENATSGTVNFSRGFAGQLEESMNGFLQRNGLFDQREDVLETRIESLDDDEKTLDRRMSAFEERLMRQFIAMESILNGLNSTGGFLENLVDTLPFTASKR